MQKLITFALLFLCTFAQDNADIFLGVQVFPNKILTKI